MLTESRQGFDDLPQGDGVLVLSPEGTVLSITLQAERLLQRRLALGRPLSLAEVFTQPYVAQVAETLKDTLASGAMRSNLLAQIRLEGGAARFLKYSVAPVCRPDGEVMAAVLTFHDDTLTRTWSAWADFGLGVEPDAVFENMDRGLFVVNQRWRITAFNRAAQEITGYSAEDVLGRNCWEIFRADHCKTGCFLRATLEDGRTRQDQEVRILDKAGRRIPLLVSTAAIRNRRQAIVGAVETFQVHKEAAARRPVAAAPPGRVEIIGQSPAMARLLSMLPQVAASEVSVVLEGESGVGKDLFAEAIHQQSGRAQGPFVALSCAALVETLLESELFGHVKGAFTGAVNHKIGRFELAKGGTLFLDEIGELKMELQTKLLRALESKVFERVGGARPIPLEARIIAATSRNLLQEVRRGRFRTDLLYRLRTVSFALPPLRERREDIPLLVQHFLTRMNQRQRKEVRGVDPKVMALFQQYAWPGNIRELERVLEYALVFVKGPVITRDHLPELESPRQTPLHPQAPLEQQLWAGERLAIQKALKKAQGRREDAARLLGISRSSLWRKMKAYDLR